MSPSSEPLDPIEEIRKHPQWFFATRTFESETFVGLLVAEAMTSAAVTAVQVHRASDWWAVHADGDWLDGDLTAFSSLIPFPDAGPNSTRVEALATAFCRVVITAVEGQVQPLSDPGSPPDFMVDLLSRTDTGRVIVFEAPSTVRATPAAVTPGERLAASRRAFSVHEREFKDV